MDLLRPTFTPIYDKQTREQLKNKFIRVSGECYVDHAGATLHSDGQMKKICHDLTNSVYPNPHSGGGSGNITQEIVERTRYRILDYFNASSDEYSLVFTSGTTSSLKCIAETFTFTTKINKKKSDGNFVYLQDNHTSILGMRDLVEQKGAKVTCLTRDEAFNNIFNEKNNYNNYDDDNLNETSLSDDNSLFVYPAQCNFSGFKYPLDWVDKAHKGALNKLINSNRNDNKKMKSKWFVLLDAACYVGTNRLDLSIHKFDFVVFSFYKMFGYPTGVGAMIVKNDCVDLLDKVYYGGGTVNMALSLKNCHVKRQIFHERFEDGTVSFLSIISLQHGFDALTSIPIDKISTHVFSLAQYLHHSLVTMHHHNGNPVVKLYTDSDYHDKSIQGGIIAFNLLRPNGKFIGFMEVLHMAMLFKIHLRTGCFCNPGACQRHLNLANDDVINNYDAGVKCGGGIDLIDGKPTGACRISFGYMSTVEDANAVVLMIRKCFLSAPEVKKIPLWFEEQRKSWNKKYGLKSFAENCGKTGGGIEGKNGKRDQNEWKKLLFDTDDKNDDKKNCKIEENSGEKLFIEIDDKKNDQKNCKSEEKGGKKFLNGIDDIKYDAKKIKTEKIDGQILSKTVKIKNGDFTETKNGILTVKKNSLELKKILIYPIKSCAAFEIKSSWNLTSKGLQYDREWMIVTSSGISLTQKQEVKLCLLKSTICLHDRALKLDYPGMPTIDLPLDVTDNRNKNGNELETDKNKFNDDMCRSRVCGHRVEGIDCGDEVSEWLSLALGRPKLKLIRQNNFDEFKGNLKPELSFSSQAQYLLINKASTEWLVDRIPEDSDCDKDTVLERFRGNLIVEGGEPFEEENWRSVKIGNEEFEVNGPCTRCQMVCIDQTTGIKTVEPLRLLAEEFNGKMKFGIYLSRKINHFNRISIGNSVFASN